MARKSAATKKAEQEQELENARQEVFCRFYAQNNELFGNGTNSYAEAYGYDLESPLKKIFTMPHPNGEFASVIAEREART